MSADMILIIDFGANQARSIARKLRGDNIYCEIVKPENAAKMAAQKAPRGLLLAGDDEYDVADVGWLTDSQVPVLAMGACARWLCMALGGSVVGNCIVDRTESIGFSQCRLFDGLVESDRYLDRVDMLELPQGLSPIAFVSGNVSPAFGSDEKKIYGLQFYAETNDPDGLTILANFAREICECEPWWTMEAFAANALEEVRREVGDGTALLAISGGVDSSVCAALMHRAVGDRLRCIFVNTGLMRRGEVELVENAFSQELGLELVTVDASARFISRLEGITGADEKRAVVADEMMRVISDEAAKMGRIDCLVQGTIYPDLLYESSSDTSHSQSSKDFVSRIEFDRLLEPLRMLFKDEVRRLGDVLGLPAEFTRRQPFPEAGLAVRCMGQVTAERLDILSRADAIFREEVVDAGLDRRIWQYFVVLTGVETNGMRDGAPVREYVAALRAVSSQDAISAYAYRLPYDLLERVVARITTEVNGISRVVYDVTGKPPAMIEWE
jgi:GMP synthase (glutamine-hydrolysing)